MLIKFTVVVGINIINKRKVKEGFDGHDKKNGFWLVENFWKYNTELKNYSSGDCSLNLTSPL